jgi:hypothetical protein
LITPNLFVQPGKLEDMKNYINQLEVVHKISQSKKVYTFLSSTHVNIFTRFDWTGSR